MWAVAQAGNSGGGVQPAEPQIATTGADVPLLAPPPLTGGVSAHVRDNSRGGTGRIRR